MNTKHDRRTMKYGPLAAKRGLYPAAILLLAAVCTAATGPYGQLVYSKNSLYHRIFVYQQGPIVTLQFGKRNIVPVQSQVNLSNLQFHCHEYTRLAFCGLLYQPEPKKILVLGLGGGVIPRLMHYYCPTAEVDVVEIDPEISVIAEQYFAFKQDQRLRVHISDGRMFVRNRLAEEQPPKYDVIILDAFNSEYIPFHLMTKEFLEQVKGILADDGVVVANVFYSNRLFDAEFKTFEAVFGRCQVYFGKSSTNAMLASPGERGPVLTVDEAVNRAKLLQRKLGLSFNMTAVAECLDPQPAVSPRAKVLTDDRAPVNQLREMERETSP